MGDLFADIEDVSDEEFNASVKSPLDFTRTSVRGTNLPLNYGQVASSRDLTSQAALGIGPELIQAATLGLGIPISEALGYDMGPVKAAREALARESGPMSMVSGIAGGMALPSNIILKALGKLPGAMGKAPSLIAQYADEGSVIPSMLGTSLDSAVESYMNAGENKGLGQAVAGGVAGGVMGGITPFARRLAQAGFDKATGVDMVQREISNLARKSGVTLEKLMKAFENEQLAKGVVPTQNVNAATLLSGLSDFAGRYRAQLPINRRLKTYWQSFPEAQGDALEKLEGETVNSVNRVKQILGTLSPDTGGRSAVQQVSEAAEKAVDDAERLLLDTQGAFYKEIYEEFPEVSMDRAEALLKDKGIKKVFNEVKSLKQYKNQPIESSKLWGRVRSTLDEIQRKNKLAKEMADASKGEKVTGITWEKSKERVADVDSMLDAATDNKHAVARKEFAKALNKDPILSQSNNIINRFAKVDPNSANYLARLKEAFGPKSEESDYLALRRALPEEVVRAGQVEVMRQGVSDDLKKNAAMPILSSAMFRERMSDLVEPETLDQAVRKLQMESGLHGQSAMLRGGSDTAPTGADIGRVFAGADQRGNVRASISQSIGNMLEGFQRDYNETHRRSLVDALINPARAEETLQSIANYEARRPGQSAFEEFINRLASSGARSSTQQIVR